MLAMVGIKFARYLRGQKLSDARHARRSRHSPHYYVFALLERQHNQRLVANNSAETNMWASMTSSTSAYYNNNTKNTAAMTNNTAEVRQEKSQKVYEIPSPYDSRTQCLPVVHVRITAA